MRMGHLEQNVFLVGFMGVGKTTVARRIARDLGVVAIDVDAYLARKHGKDATQLFKQRGEKGLRRLETRALAECANMGPAIISCGEGIVASPASRAILMKDGFAVLLESSEETSLGRIRSLRTRPLLAQGCDTTDLWNERKPLYEEVARAKVNVQGKSTAAVAASVAKVLSSEGVYRAGQSHRTSDGGSGKSGKGGKTSNASKKRKK